MAKNKVSEWDAVSDNNITINGININENCPPSAINNAIREMMAQIKQWQSGYSGDSWTSSGTLDITGSLKLDGNLGTTGQVMASQGSTATPIWKTLGTMSNQNSSSVTTGDLNVTGAFRLDSSTGTAGQVMVSTGTSATPTWGNAFIRGMIMLWTGSAAPSGWAICNGSSGTPDLRDKFVMGAGGSLPAGGGYKDAAIVSHSHTLSGTSAASSITGTAAASSISGTAAASSISGTAAASSLSGSVAAGGGHTHSASTTVNTSSGLSGWWDFKNRGGTSYATPMLAASSGGKCTHKNQSNSKSYGEGYRGEGGSGSSRASINVNHNHSGSTTVNAVGNHTHTLSGTAAASSISGTAAASAVTGTAAASSISGTAAASSVTGSAVATGIAATNRNLPPYYALAYIMKL